ncbi:MAG: ATP-binding protein [Lachnospiraceae bacterium]|nr:ATP-binding protein [Lachnospiraceae bacterium]
MKKSISPSSTIKEFKAVVSNLPVVQDYVKSIMSDLGCGKQMISSIDVAVEEVFVNIASYGYEEDAQYRPCWVESGEADGYFYLAFKDKGKPYNPLEKEDPVIGDPDRMTIGGYGIFMVKTIADEVTYEYDNEEGLNILIMKEKIIK